MIEFAATHILSFIRASPSHIGLVKINSIPLTEEVFWFPRISTVFSQNMYKLLIFATIPSILLVNALDVANCCQAIVTGDRS